VRADGTKSRNLTDLGSQEKIEVGNLKLGWSNGRNGQASWIYFQQEPGIEFVQRLEDIDQEFISDLSEQRNIFSSSAPTRALHAYGATTTRSAGDTPLAQIAGIQQIGDQVLLELNNLTIGSEDLIERSTTVGQGDWLRAGSYVATDIQHTWSPVLDAGAEFQFFRVQLK
jgi:hypothetical protein